MCDIYDILYQQLMHLNIRAMKAMPVHVERITQCTQNSLIQISSGSFPDADDAAMPSGSQTIRLRRGLRRWQGVEEGQAAGGQERQGLKRFLLGGGATTPYPDRRMASGCNHVQC